MHRYRSIFPVTVSVSNGHDPDASRQPANVGPNRTRNSVAAACTACRKRKVKCSGDRPKCAECIKRKRACHYNGSVGESSSQTLKRNNSELRAESASYARLFDAIRSRSEGDVRTLVCKIRRGENMDDIAREMEYGDLLIQSALVPESRFRYEFPISPNMPSYLLSRDNSYLDSLIYDWTRPKTSINGNNNDTDPDSPTSSGPRPKLQHQKSPNGMEARYCTPYLKPYHAAEICDSQIDNAVPSKWTSVCTDNQLMRRLIRAFLLQDHDFWTAFQKDYFLDDMANMGSQFCSPLLVNAVLALSCVSATFNIGQPLTGNFQSRQLTRCLQNYYRGLTERTEFWNPATLGNRFLSEAKRLWAQEMHTCKLTTIQAALILHVIYTISGADKIGLAYVAQACTMARTIGLFDADMGTNSKLHCVRTYTAWALFSWQSLVCSHNLKPPLISHSPDCVLPDPKERPQWYGETWLKYPSDDTLYPSHSGYAFKAKCEFSIIMNDITRRLFEDAVPSQALTAIEVAQFYVRLHDWYQGLPDAISPQNAVLPMHLKIHMHYFQILQRLLQCPCLDDTHPSPEQAAAVNMLGQPPQQMVRESRINLEILLRAYYLRHGFEWLDSYLISVLLDCYVSAVTEMQQHVGKQDVQEYRSTILLMAKGIYEQGQSAFLAQLVFHIAKNKLCAQDMSTLQRFVILEPIGEIQAASHHHVQMDWPVEVISMLDDPKSKSMQRLINDLKGAVTVVGSKQEDVASLDAETS